MAKPERLYSLLRDPEGLESLETEGGELVNRAGNRRYPIVDSIPALVAPAKLGPRNLKFQRMYDRLSWGYDAAQWLGEVWYRGKIAQMRRWLAASLGLKPGQCLLYTSIGTGSDLPFLSEQVPLKVINLVGVDLSMGMLRRCRRRLGALGDTALLVRANAECLPLADRSFDTVLHVGGINFFDHPDVAVREMVRVAKPGALIVLADETGEVVRSSYKRSPLTRSYFKGEAEDFSPRSWVPANAVDSSYEEVWDGKIYVLKFRVP